MDFKDFLRRVIPRGNYLILAYPSSERGRPGVHRAFPVTEDGYAQAEKLTQWLIDKRQYDIWHAVASYKEAVRRDAIGGVTYVGLRRSPNVEAIKCFIIDQDVKRKDDGKENVFASRQAAVQWLKSFCSAVGLPLPNLGVGSGYGLHWYWLIETALTVSEWKPYAEALRRAMGAHGWTGDTSPTVDAARILRPPSTLNFKVQTDPKPVTVLGSSPDYPNDVILGALNPWLGGAGGLGPKPGHASGGAGLNQNAQAEIEPRDFSIYEIAKKCAQVGVSLAKGGEGDGYELWRSHALTCARCVDGREGFHELSAKHKDYDHAKTEAYFDQTLERAEREGLGATRCETYNSTRPGVCEHCPYWGQIPSPLRLGAPDGDLPEGYRRVGNGFLQQVEGLHGTNGKAEWARLFFGDVHSPQLDEDIAGGHQLNFIYHLGLDAPKSIVVPGKLGAPATIQGLLAGQGFNIATPDAVRVGRFLVAWINKIQRDGAARTDRTNPYGWNWHAGKRLGVAIAGDHYLCAGGQEKVAGGDPHIAHYYRPAGNFDAWRKAASLFEHKRADLQLIIGFGVAAPLLSLCADVHGLTANFFSPASGIGKTSAFRVGQTFWGSPLMMSSMTDTFNAVMKSMSEPKIFPRYWDEFTLTRDQEDDFNRLIFNIPQGKERSRMDASTQLREVRTWRTFLVISANKSYTDLLLRLNLNTDASLLRLLEFQLPKDVRPFPPGAGAVLDLVEANYGHAGRIFLRHLASRHQAVQDYLLVVMRKLGKSLGAQQEERFYITAMACVIVACGIARDLKLFDFDLAGIYDELKKAFYAARNTRKSRTVITSAGTFDLGQLVSNMYSDMANERLVTTYFSNTRVKVMTVSEPQTNKTWLQVATNDKKLRVLRSRLFEWLSKNNYPSEIVMGELMNHGAVQSRLTIGAGTQYSTGQQNILEIPLTGIFSGLLDDTPMPMIDDDVSC